MTDKEKRKSRRRRREVDETTNAEFKIKSKQRAVHVTDRPPTLDRK